MSEPICGIQSFDPVLLPLLRTGVQTHYEGSIDKKGGNADWDWWLYPDEKGEWVLFDVIGPGCIYNFVQHRYPDSVEPTFRFYFDGEDTPRFTIRHSQFGEVHPFVEPLASRYIGPYDNGRGPIRVVRSFVPMPFQKSCRITSDIRLEGFDRAKGEGGWGHVVYQTYPEDACVRTFSPADDYSGLIRLWKRAGTGSPVVDMQSARRRVLPAFTLRPGESRTLFASETGCLVSGIRLRLNGYDPACLSALWVRASFDGHETPDLYAPFGCFFANELGYNAVHYLYAGMNTDGDFYNFLPMPCLSSACIEVVNTGNVPVDFDGGSVTSTEEFNALYASRPFGYLRTSAYYPRSHTEGRDSIIGVLRGHGHVVGSVITAHAATPETYASCEGDVRVHFDGIRTPQIESDGSESYSCYGWGFPTPPECHPAGGYDGYNHRNWSMTRFLPGDVYPFTRSCRFGIESGGNNDEYLEHSGIVFWYGRDGESSRLLCEVPTGEQSLTAFFEGDDDDVPVTARGDYGKEACFTVQIPAGTKTLLLRRLSDQREGRQRGMVYADGVRLARDWYFADRNPEKRWLEDEYLLPERAVAGKTEVTLRILPASESWNAFGYQVYARFE